MDEIKSEFVENILDTKYIKVYDLEYDKDKHYFDATRRSKENLLALKSNIEIKQSLPDAVSCVVCLKTPDEIERLYVMNEYRYPIGRYVLSVLSGLIDQTDKESNNPIRRTTIRELEEETGIIFDERKDCMSLINPLLFCSPGMIDESTAVIKLTLNRDKIPSTSTLGAIG